MQLTMIDLLSGVVGRAKTSILSLGDAGKTVKKDFDDMTRNITSGLKAIAIAGYALHKIKPGVAAAADLQESLIEVRMSLMRSGKDASTLGDELKQVRDTAVDLQKITPFSAQDVVSVQKELMNSGLEFQDVVGKGAARAAMMLATITKQAPETAASAMLGVGIPYHLKGNEYGEVADVIQKHVMSGRMKLPQLTEALPYINTVAKNFKLPWHDMLTGLAVLGEQSILGSHAGTSLADFYERLVGTSRISRRALAGINQELRQKGKAPLKFWDDKGELKPTLELIKTLRSSLGSFDTHKKMYYLEKIFGKEGGRGALGLMSEGAGSWEFVKQKLNEVAGAEEKMTERLKGFNASLTALGGTSKTTLATLFDPMLNPLSLIAQTLNDVVGNIGLLADQKPIVATIFSGVVAGTAVTAGVLGLAKLATGAVSGLAVLRGLRGIPGFSLAAGVAEGKALQAATGVNSVFVVNWPASLGGAGSTAASIAEAAAAGGAAGGVAGGAAGAVASAISAASAISIPVIAASAMAYFSRKTGEYLATDEAKWRSIPDLKKLRMQHMVLGGGPNSFQVQAIDNELKKWGQDPGIWQRTLDAQGQGAVKNDIQLYLNIDSSGLVTSRTNHMDTTINTMKRGSFFEALMSPAGMGY